MLWIAASLFFLWLAVREVLSVHVAPRGFDNPVASSISVPYVAVAILLAAALAWPPFHAWRFERLLSAKATELADGHAASVHCNTVFDTFLDPESLAIGHASPDTGAIVLQTPWCGVLEDYLAHPAKASMREIVSLGVFTHEAMHVRGELNEARTECAAIQRNAQAARLLGVPDDIAADAARRYYEVVYAQRQLVGGMNAPYWTADCAPGGALDEHLSDTFW